MDQLVKTPLYWWQVLTKRLVMCIAVICGQSAATKDVSKDAGCDNIIVTAGRFYYNLCALVALEC